MNSPDKISLTRYIRIHRNKTEPIYLQIVYQFINAVQRGYLQVGEKLPGSRIISEDLGVHRKTIVAAFDELQAQGWVEIKPKVGTFVANPQTKRKIVESSKQVEISTNDVSSFSFQKSFVLDSPFEEHSCTWSLNDGQPDYRLVKTEELARFYRNALRRKQVQKYLGTTALRTNQYFLQQLSYYLNLSKGFHISQDHLVIGDNKEQLLFVISQLLLKPNDCVVVGELNYFFANMIFKQSEADIKIIPMDENGIDVSSIRTNFKKGDITCVYINSITSYPTMVPLSEERREMLLQLAEEYDFVIIEDGSGDEFQFSKTVAPSLFVQSGDNRVIYINTFGKMLIPSFELGYIVAPKDFIKEAEKFMTMLVPKGDLITEQALGEMIEEGDIFRIIKKSNLHYNERRNSFVAKLKELFKDELSFRIPTNGLALWIEWKKPISLHKLVTICKKNDLFIPRICCYQTKKANAMLVGFGDLTKEEMENVCDILKKSYDEVIQGD